MNGSVMKLGNNQFKAIYHINNIDKESFESELNSERIQELIKIHFFRGEIFFMQPREMYDSVVRSITVQLTDNMIDISKATITNEDVNTGEFDVEIEFSIYGTNVSEEDVLKFGIIKPRALMRGENTLYRLVTFDLHMWCREEK